MEKEEGSFQKFKDIKKTFVKTALLQTLYTSLWKEVMLNF